MKESMEDLRYDYEIIGSLNSKRQNVKRRFTMKSTVLIGMIVVASFVSIAYLSNFSFTNFTTVQKNNSKNVDAIATLKLLSHISSPGLVGQIPQEVIVNSGDLRDWVAKDNRISYNLSPLRLPEGLPWQYAVSGRAPTWHHKDYTVKGADQETTAQQALIVFGANMTENGGLQRVSPVTVLAVPSPITDECQSLKYIYGAEDARLLWSDEKRPMMITIRTSGLVGHCRSISIVPDIRSYWPELAEIMAKSPLIPSLYSAKYGYNIIEANWKNGTQKRTEKNWMPFFRGPIIDPDQAYPHFLYSQNPLLTLAPSIELPEDTNDKNGGRRRVKSYESLEQHAVESCAKRMFPEARKIHNATPMYRITLCDRDSCIPDKNNTVLMSITHIKTEEGNYDRFVSIFSTNQVPLTTLFIGPRIEFQPFHKSGFIFVLGMAFEPQSGQEKNYSERIYGIGHGFLDDEVVIGAGVGDSSLFTIRASVKELLVGLRSCTNTIGL